MNPKSRRLWLMPALASIALVALLLTFTDAAILRTLWHDLPWPLLLAGLLILQLEGVCSAVRLRVSVAPASSLFDNLVVTAWWVAGLVVLPARLGEIGGMHMLVRRLGVAPGAAVNSLLVQRLFDVLILFVLGSTVIAAQSTLLERDHLMLVLALAAAVAVVLIARLVWWFTLLARLVRPYRRWSIMRAILRLALSARRAAIAVSGTSVLVRIGIITLLKWTSNLAAIAIIIVALLPLMPWSAALLVAIMFNLAAVVPLQTVGGIGLGEVTFAASLSWYGVELATAASAALVLRAVLIVGTLLFSAIVLLFERVLASATPPGGEH